MVRPSPNDSKGLKARVALFEFPYKFIQYPRRNICDIRAASNQEIVCAE